MINDELKFFFLIDNMLCVKMAYITLFDQKFLVFQNFTNLEHILENLKFYPLSYQSSGF